MKNTIFIDDCVAYAATSLTAAFDAMNAPEGLRGPTVLLRIINNSTSDVSVSYDGDAYHDFVPKGTSLQLNFQANSAPNNKVAMLRHGTQVYLAGSAGTGNIYLAVYYLKA